MLRYFLEIKSRFLLLMFTWLSTLFMCYLNKEILLFIIVQPSVSSVNAFYFIFTNVTEIFSVYIKLTVFLCSQVFFFYLALHCFAFLNLAIFKKESFYLKIFLKISLLVWVCSAIANNLILVPITWQFFLSFQNLISLKFVKLHFEAKISEFLSFYITIHYLFIYYCQIFTIIYLHINCVDNKLQAIQKFRKLYYYFFIVFSTLVSTPEVFSQFFIGGLVILLYELFIFSFLLKIKLIR